MKKYVHCAFVRHSVNPDRAFLFSVPIEENLKADTNVICYTKYGEKEGRVISDSFLVSEKALESICIAVGAKLPLKPIIGTLEKRMVTAKSYFGGTNMNADDFENVPF